MSGTSGSTRELSDIRDCHPCSRSTVLPMSPVAQDAQQPHKEDEVYYVVSGRATVRVGDEDRAVQAGSVILAAPGVPHRFHSITEELRILVVFAPAEGTAK